MKNLIKTIGLLALFLMPMQTRAATLGLSPGSAELISGCVDTISIVVDTEGANSLAADAFLSYNPSEIEIIDQNSGIAGIQLGIGSAYESYPGNIADNGSIRLTGFNKSGFFNGRGVLGKIRIRGKPGVTSSAISFQFSPGSSVDSNVADQNSADILRSVANATLSFIEGKCPTVKPPAEIKEPLKPSEAEKLREELEKCQDQLTVLEGYYKAEESEITAALCQGLKPAAPPGPPGGLLLFLLILFALSLLLNIDMLVRPENHVITYLPFVGKKRHKKARFKKQKISKK